MRPFPEKMMCSMGGGDGGGDGGGGGYGGLGYGGEAALMTEIEQDRRQGRSVRVPLRPVFSLPKKRPSARVPPGG